MFKTIKGFFNREKKSAYSPFMSFANALAFNGWNNLSSYMSMLYYVQVSPLYDAVDKISKECASLELFTQNTVTKKFEKQHPVLDLLAAPNTDMGYMEFFTQAVSYYEITGNCYIVATGDVGKPPLELFVISPEFITLIPNEFDGYTDSINYSSSQNNIHFKREIVNGRYRFYDAEKKREIWHIRKFQPLRGVTNNYGLSPLSPLYYEIEQYIKASLHNLSLLARGARPSGAFSTTETLSDSAFARLTEQLDRFNAGAENAGRPLLLEGGLSFQEMSVNNKDMDFAALKNGLKTQIYSVFNIPLPLVSIESMTYSNYETSKLALYDFAVLPLEARLLQEFSNFLMYRYKEDKKTVITYNKDAIPALLLRRNEELTLTKNLGVNTINEIRAMKGDKPVVGGDDIYLSSTSYPIASARQDLPEETEDANDLASDQEKVNRLDYWTRMRHLKQVDGRRAFNDDEIKQLGVKYGIFK